MWVGLQFFARSCQFLPSQQPHDAHAGSDKNDKLALLFEEWSGAREDWTRSEMVTQMRTKGKQRVKGCRKWLTLSEITKKYNSESIAVDICKSKIEDETLSKTQVRYHPDLPGRDDMRQFLVYDYSEEIDQHDSVVEALFRCEDMDSTSEQKGRRRGRSPERKSRKKQKKTKKVSSSSSTASSASRSSSKSSSQQSNQTRRTTKTTRGKKHKKDKKDRKDKDKEMTDAERKRVEKEKAKEDEREKKKLEKAEAKRQKEEEKAQEKAKKKEEAEQKRELQKIKEKKRSAAKKV